MKYTKGPWTAAVYQVTPSMVERIKIGSFHHAVCTNHDPREPNELLIALCGDEPGLDSQSAADARLISYAPEMFELLETLATRYTFKNVTDFRQERRELAELVCRVIAKIEGKK